MTTATLTPTRLPGLRAALARALDHVLAAASALLRPAPVAVAVALLAAGAAALLVTLGPTAAEAQALAATEASARG